MILVLLILQFFYQSFALENNQSLKLEILEENVIADEKSQTLKMKFKITNESDINYLFYAMSETEDAFSLDSNYCKCRGVGGVAIAINSKWGKRIIAPYHYTFELNKPPVTYSDVEKSISNTKKRINESKTLIKAGKDKKFELSHEFDFYELSKGSYEIYLIYFLGQNITKYVSDTEIADELISNDAELFQGCVISKPVELIVK